MKNLFQTLLFSAFCLFVITACNKEEMTDLTPVTDDIENTDELQAMTPQPALPDLVIRNIRSNLVIGSGPCPGPDKANGTCSSGANSVQLKATLRNRTSVAIPANVDIIVKWEEFGQAPIFSILSGGLAGNTSKTITSPAYMLDCPVGPPPFQLITRTFFAEADPNDAINEFNENNNFSTRYNVCDDE